MHSEKRGREFYILAIFFALFVLFLYGPLSAILILAFQGPNGGLTLSAERRLSALVRQPLRAAAVGDFGGSFRRSFMLGVMVMIVTVLVSLLAGLAFRRKFVGATPLFYLSVASLVVPSIIISLGIGVLFQQLGLEPAWYSSAFGAQLTWTLPFGVLIMFAVFNRFSPSYEEAARDLGANSWQTFSNVVLPMIAPSLIGSACSASRFPMTSLPELLTSGTYNTLPLEIYGMHDDERHHAGALCPGCRHHFLLSHRHRRNAWHHCRHEPPPLEG